MMIMIIIMIMIMIIIRMISHKDDKFDKDDNHKQFEPVEGWRWSIGS